MKDEIIAGLDVGSTNIRLVIGQKTNTIDGEELQIIGAVSSPTMGVSKGSVNSIEDATSSISACLEKAERLVGVPMSSVWASLNNPKVKCEKSKGVVVVSKSDGEIDENDVERAVEAARSMVVPNNYEIIHVVPIKFTIDNQEDIKDPIGMSGVRLEVETLIILALSNQIKNLTKAIYRTGLDIDALVLSSLAASEACLDNRQKDLGVALLDMGATTSSLAVYEEGNLLHTAVLPIGASHVTSDVALGLRCPVDLAERIKVEYGHSESEYFTKKDEVDVAPLAQEQKISDEIGIISRKYLAEIIEARMEELFEMVDEELKKIDRSGMLPSGIVLTGGGSLLQGLVETAKRKLRLPASLAEAKNVKVAVDKAKSPEFMTALGLVIWGSHASGTISHNPLRGKLNQALGGVRKLFSKIMPQ